MKFIEDDAEKNLEGINIFGFKLMDQDDVLECDIIVFDQGDEMSSTE